MAELNRRSRRYPVILMGCFTFLPTSLQAREQGHLVAVPVAKLTAPNGEVDPGQSLFERNCSVCHGIAGTGGRGPNLTRARLSRAPDDVALRAVIVNGIAPEMPAGGFLTDEDVGALTKYVWSLGESAIPAVTGSSARGKNVFVRNGCPACHIFAEEGAAYGPELTDVSERRSVQYIAQAILKPAEHLPADFLMVQAETATGGSIRGIRANEDTFTIQIKDQTGRFYSFRKSGLKRLRQQRGETPMPSFEGALTDTELEDLIAYLESPSKEP